MHRQTNRHCYSRQGCAEKIYFKPDGSIPQVEMTSNGLSDKPLAGKGEYGAYIACNLMSGKGAGSYTNKKEDFALHPCFTQQEEDGEKGPGTYIADISDKTVIGYKYFNLQNTTYISLKVRGTGKGKMFIKNNLKEEPVGYINIVAENEYKMFHSKVRLPANANMIFFIFEGSGKLDFQKFILQ
ncbi:MAG: hypothetical protein PHG02_02275 [Oscillospiraceae bacterium]|nr:hypothetical protein [Oscillospiraceae bacterium]